MLNMICIGIDPGADGAIVILEPNNRIEIYDMPTLEIQGAPKKSKKTGETKPSNKTIIDGATLSDTLLSFAQGTCHGVPVRVIIEDVHAMPQQGVSSMFSFGMSYGTVLGILAAYQIPFSKVHPKTWKKIMMDGMGKEKDASVARALQLFPTLRDQLITIRGRKLDGRADALLMAEYLRRQESGLLVPAPKATRAKKKDAASSAPPKKTLVLADD